MAFGYLPMTIRLEFWDNRITGSNSYMGPTHTHTSKHSMVTSRAKFFFLMGRTSG